MKIGFRCVLFGIFLLFAAGFGYAAESVQIVSDLNGIVSGLVVRTHGISGTEMDISIPAVALNSVSLNGMGFKEVQLPESDHLALAEIAEDGRPNVPALTSFLAIPDEAGVQLSVSYSGYDVINDIDLAPVQPSQVEGNFEPIPFTIDNQTYNADAFYPGNLAEVGEPVIMRDIRMVQVAAYPVQYNPVSRQLRVYRDLSVSLSYEGQAINPKTTHSRYISDGFYPIYKALLANCDQTLADVEVKRGGYLIIAKQMFVDSLRQLALWKHKKGYSVQIIPTTQIVPNGNPNSTNIFNYIKNAYNTWEVPPEYVMIVGDKDNTTTTGIPDYPYSSFSSDHHYACVDGTDYIPDIFVARMSIDNMSELVRVVSKIMKYESHPFMADSSYWTHGLSVAHTGFQSARTTVLWVRQALMRQGFTRVDTSFSTGTDPNLPRYFNDGVSIISYRGYASSDGWWGPSFRSADLMALLNNQKLGVMASLVCGTGDFGTECFGETWLRMGYSVDSLKGGPAFYGVSDYGTHTRWNNPIMVGYYFGILNEGVYHFAAGAVRGKLQQYRTFPRYRGAGQYVEQYFNTYNMLGDPELEMRTAIPQRISVRHDDILNFGTNHIEIVVTNLSGPIESPVEGAFVTLIKNDGAYEEVFEVGNTDASGRVTLSFDSPTIGEMHLTVSGRNLYPYQGQVQIINSDITVGLDSLTIDAGGNGLAEPNEIVRLGISLKNFGTVSTASGITSVLEPIDEEMAQVINDSNQCVNLAPGQSAELARPYIVHISPNATNGELAKLKLTITDSNDDSWFSEIKIPIAAPKFVVGSVTFPGGNSQLDPGDTASMVISLKNVGAIEAQNVTARLTTEDDYTKIISDWGDFGSIAINDSANNASSAMVVLSEPSTFNGHAVNFILHVTTSSGVEAHIPFQSLSGVKAVTDPVGPDAYGYYIYDNTDTGYVDHPDTQWVEINPNLGGPGQRINFGSNTDDNSVMITLPFDFIYYGQAYRPLIVCTNGFIAPDTSRYDIAGHFWNNFFNWPIPDPGNARGQISPFWDDLSFSGSTNGIYSWYDSVNHKYYIEWSGLINNNTSATETFQMVISDPIYYPTLTGDSEILFVYKNINNNDSAENYATVGFESWDELTGLEYTHDGYYTSGGATLTNSRALKINTNSGRGGIKGNVELINNSDNGNAKVHTSSGEYRITPQTGNYWIMNVPPGVVDVTAEANGYFPVTLADVAVELNRTIDRIDFELNQCPIPSGLTASEGLGDRIQIAWHGVSNQALEGYNIYRGNWEYGLFTKLNDTPLNDTLFDDNAAPDSGNYWYYATASFADSGWDAESFMSNKAAGSLGQVTEVADNGAPKPDKFVLSQNYPNPFNITTVIKYALPKASLVTIDVYDILGRKVATVKNDKQEAGYHQIVWKAENISSGMYFYRIQAGGFAETKKMLLMK